jgi:hypothetical protein
MTELALPVGLGLAAKGSVSDAVAWGPLDLPDRADEAGLC